MKSITLGVPLGIFCTALAVAGAPVLTGLHSFSVFPDGEQPEAPLIQGRDGSFYGTTAGGGTNGGFGTVFRITTNGVATALYSFTGGSDGANPQAGLVQATDGFLYGTTAFGGDTNGDGTIFKVSTNGALTTLYLFTNGVDGSEPVAGLVQGKDGGLYGTASFGGDASGDGTIFRITTSGTFTNVYVFTGGLDGSGPAAGLIQGVDGFLYGTAEFGGDPSQDAGSIFQVSTNGTIFNEVYLFADGADGGFPTAGLIQGFDGSLYGTASSGGDQNGDGTIFQITTGGSFTELYMFTGGTDGSGPAAALIQAANGILYGTAEFGGDANGDGTLFQITTNGFSAVFTTIHDFTNGADGSAPEAALLQARDGSLYGTAAFGYTNGAGTIFRINASVAYATWFAFPGADDGNSLVSDLVLGQDGNYYGMAEGGGEFNSGAIFRATPAGVVTELYSFGTMGVDANGDPLDGASPEGALVQGSNGILYGTASGGGSSGSGTIFSVTTNGAFSLLYTFTGASDGGFPSAGLVFGKDGSLYGTASSGGDANGDGTIFQITTGGTYAVIYTFTGTTDGSGPVAPLIQGSDDNLYGTAEFGGNTNIDGGTGGTIFAVSTNGQLFDTLYLFNDGADGANPVAGLVQGTDGLFYGTATTGGTFTNGTVFNIDSKGNFTALAQFDGTNGTFPQARLILGNDGNFYGTAGGGGTNDNGTLFQMTPKGVLTPLWLFSGGDDGANPDAALIPAANGVFYGLASGGGMGGNGELFKLDLRPTVQSVSKNGTSLAIAWMAVPELNYQIQYATNLTQAIWSNFSSSISATNNPMQAAVSIGPDSKRFYRVVLLP